MSLAEGSSASVRYKFYSDGVITPGTPPTPATAPGNSGGQLLRRTTCTLNLSKDTFQSNEQSTHRQIVDLRHGTRRVQGNITGDWSPGTYFDFFEALFRGTREGALTKTEADVTSVAAVNATSKLTLGGSTWAAQGFRVGDTVRLSNASVSGNNGVNFLITALSGVDATVYPAPTDMSADTTITITRPGSRVYIPTSGHVRRKALIEHYSEDVDLSRLFLECRTGSGRFQLPSNGMATVDFGLMGRDMQVLESGSAPFFASPTAETTTGIAAAVGGYVAIGGTRQAVVTGLDFSVNLNPSADPVVGSPYVPEIFLGRAVVTGTLTAFWQDASLINDFINEAELEILTTVGASSDADAEFNTIFMPRVKLTGAELPIQGEGGQTLSIPFQALLPASAATGYTQSSIILHDSVAVTA